MSTQEIDFTAGTDSHPNDPHVETPGRVHQVAVPPAARTLSTLPHIDYEDAFLVETGPAQDRTGEQWARAILEDAPIIALLGASSRLGLPAKLLCKRQQQALLFATLRATGEPHRTRGVDRSRARAPTGRAVPLERASRRIRERSETDER